MAHLRHRSFTDDPLAVLTRPPPNETPAERQQRLAEERLAQQQSDLIDEQIKQERAAKLQAEAAQRKLLLLGQAESGKTTTLKQFQLLQSESAFSAQLNSYRALIYLNILHSVRHILDAVALPDNDPLSDASSSSSQDSVPHQNYPPHITALVTRLRPLLHVQTVIERQLQDSDETQVPRRSRRAGSSASSGDDSVRPEVTVHAWSCWSERFTSKSKLSSPTDSISMDWSSQDDPGRVFESCGDALIALWEDETVQGALAQQRPSIRESPGFFMDDLARITARGYMPSQADILRARIRTLGVQEHTVRFERGPDSGLEWKIFDVGGARSQRLRWAAYFQDVNAIIFLAPISPFNQTLSEDPRMNRVKDSLLLWQDICRNKVLEKVSIVLFLNKCDLLKAKLQAGVQFRKYMTAYEGPNEWEPVAEFLKAKFDEVYRASCKPGKRTLYIHRTSVVDSRAMQKIITSVREQIMKEALAAVGLF